MIRSKNKLVKKWINLNKKGKKPNKNQNKNFKNKRKIKIINKKRKKWPYNNNNKWSNWTLTSTKTIKSLKKKN